jgi:hypothetical protein
MAAGVCAIPDPVFGEAIPRRRGAGAGVSLTNATSSRGVVNVSRR